MCKTRIMELDELGQSAWLDYISRELIDTGKLNSLIKLNIGSGVHFYPAARFYV